MQQDKPDRATDGGHLMNEPDIGSGEKTPGEKETEELVRTIKPPPVQPPEPPKP
ncbi:hypothetical protein [Pseudoduganella rhizocola]|uniref:hypothetical protein n=1 Tax=Pseudoduganella rhizocola TaxID=3382643 RepID=UPI0038B64764